MQVNGTGLRITELVDGVSRRTSLSWHDNELAGMLAPGADAGQGLTFTYSGQTLTEIVHEDQEKVSYRYAAGTKLLTDVINVDGMRALRIYGEGAVSHAEREDLRDGAGCGNGSVSPAYEYLDTLTVVTDKLSGKKLRYHFNDCGNLLALSDELGFGAFASYAPVGPLNKPEAVSRLQKSVCNLVRDPLMEREDVWQQTVSEGAGTFAYDTDTKSIGWRSPRMDKTSDGCSAGGEDSDGWCGSGMASTHAGAMHGGVETALLEARGKPGKVWYDGAQVEAGVTPGRLNLLSNGNFAFDAMDWVQENGVTAGAVFQASGLAGLARRRM